MAGEHKADKDDEEEDNEGEQVAGRLHQRAPEHRHAHVHREVLENRKHADKDVRHNDVVELLRRPAEPLQTAKVRRLQCVRGFDLI